MTTKHEIIGTVERRNPQVVNSLRGQVMLIKDPQTQQESLYYGNPSAKPGITTTNDRWYLNAQKPLAHAGKWKPYQFIEDMLIPHAGKQIKITITIEELN